ncbi:DMT family transporter [Microbulbifer agarilyticus]|uniref:DMT family transporter n=1 Tax=Microbulbifer agarilyticus TaxID=260552 RepID=UPI001C9735E2|nr:DMT family transporter [Microbulbifer agarilyticus]MBY6189664.1 DMT family transporter [Microbulbifer agarilyticus]
MIQSNQQSTQGISAGLLMALGAAALFALKAIFVKLAYRYGVDVETFILLRMVFALPFYLAIAIYIASSKNWTPMSGNDWVKVIALGVCSYYLASYLDLQGLRYISANFARLVLYLYPTLVLLLGFLFLGRRPSKREIICVAGAYCGIFMIYWQDQGFSTGTPVPAWVPVTPLSWGALLAFASALCFATYVTFSEGIIRRLGSQQFTALAMLAASVAIMGHFSIQGDFSRLLQPWPVYAYALTVAFVCTVLPTLLLNAAIEHIGSTRTGAISSIGPVFTLFTAAWILGEPFGAYHLVGMAIIIGSLSLLRKKR